MRQSLASQARASKAKLNDGQKKSHGNRQINRGSNVSLSTLLQASNKVENRLAVFVPMQRLNQAFDLIDIYFI
jgi:hypothetical protein